MTTRPTTKPSCEYERVDREHHSYCCEKKAVVEWVARPDAVIPLCNACLVWLQRLEELGQLK